MGDWRQGGHEEAEEGIQARKGFREWLWKNKHLPEASPGQVSDSSTFLPCTWLESLTAAFSSASHFLHQPPWTLTQVGRSAEAGFWIALSHKNTLIIIKAPNFVSPFVISSKCSAAIRQTELAFLASCPQAVLLWANLFPVQRPHFPLNWRDDYSYEIN